MIPDFRSLVDVLRFRAEAQGDSRAYTFLVDGEIEGAAWTYAELDERARGIAATLQASGVRPGERALLLYPPGLDFVAAFFGCLYAGVIAVPVDAPRPAQVARTLQRLLGIAGDAEVSVVLGCESVTIIRHSLATGAPALAALHWLATDRIAAVAADTWRDPDLGPHAIAFLQYTSGSTAAPKGVLVNHGNLLHNLAYANHVEENDAQSTSVSWLPVHHDMGLIEGVLEPAFAGYPAYLMSPTAFVQRPSCWLQAISRYRATNSGGPNFAYDLCVRKIPPEQRATLDLNSWRVAYNGAEPIRADTLHAFMAAFAPCGFRWNAFYPVFGLAEATLVVSSGRRAYEPVVLDLDAAALARGRVETRSVGRAARLVSSGRPSFGTRVVIADPDARTRCAAGVVGEVWLATPSVAQGYWRRPDESEHTFRAHLADTGEGPFLRTGDLGFLVDGELFIAGRLKDVMIVRGLKVFPQDVEQSVERRHQAVRPGCCAAFSVDDGSEERIVVVAEMDPRRLVHEGVCAGATALDPLPADLETVMVALRRGIAEEHELQIHALSLLAAGTIPKTSSGKIRRHACRAGFLAGTLEELARWTRDAECERWAARGATAVLGAAPITP